MGICSTSSVCAGKQYQKRKSISPVPSGELLKQRHLRRMEEKEELEYNNIITRPKKHNYVGGVYKKSSRVTVLGFFS